ncbi:MAG: DUF2974 domain-containing protein [Clostridia bacterium]|nr:DUF2974 domain-containing protein [Clostridia bacterium]
MAGVEEYIRNYGDKSFTEMPFCEADNVALCNIFYLPLEKIVSASFDDEPMDFAQVCKCFYSYNGCKHIPAGLLLSKNISKRLMQMSECKRFAEMKIVAVQEKFCVSPATQFAACTVLLPDGKVVVVFRGTDDTLIGWKEDFDLYITKGIPSHALAVEYLGAVAAHFEGKIIVCGHSKGGNLALYAALKCEQETRDRIECLYNNDGPGFVDASLFRTPQYKEIVDRYKHFLPTASFVGTLLTHDYDYTVVGSKRVLGPLQHDLLTWKISGTELIAKDELNILGKIADLGLMELVTRFNHDQGDNVGTVMQEVILGSGQTGLTGVAKNAVSAVSGGWKAWKERTDDEREDFKKFLFDIPRCLVAAAFELGKGAATAAEKRATEFVDAIAAN